MLDLDLILGWAVVFFPTALAVAFIFIPARNENENVHMKWRYCLVIFGILFSLLAWLQQTRTAKAAASDRESAIKETSARVASETSDRVTKAMSAQYEETISGLNRQIGNLQGQLHSINQTAAENVKTMTGGDSVCWLMLMPHQGILSVAQRGKYPLHNVSARMTDIEKMTQITSSQPLTIDPIFAADRNFEIGDMAVSSSKLLDTHYVLTGNKHSFNVFFAGLNGFWTEELRLRLVDGEWAQALRVTRSITDGSGKMRQKLVFQQIDKTFPRSPQGDVQWN